MKLIANQQITETTQSRRTNIYRMLGVGFTTLFTSSAFAPAFDQISKGETAFLVFAALVASILGFLAIDSVSH